jgi:hypothetical protein
LILPRALPQVRDWPAAALGISTSRPRKCKAG